MTYFGHPVSGGVLHQGGLSLQLPHEKFILFELAGRASCVIASAVAEVVAPLAVTPLPEGPEWLLGLAAHRGEIIAVIDPKTIADEPPASQAGPKSKLIIFRPQPEGTQFALPVDAIRELFTAEHVGNDVSLPRSPFQTIEIIRQDGPVPLLDHLALFESFYSEQVSA